MNWWYKQIVIDEEAHQEMKHQEALDMAEYTKFSVAVPDTPLSDR
jgi:hypothetical protein